MGQTLSCVAAPDDRHHRRSRRKRPPSTGGGALSRGNVPSPLHSTRSSSITSKPDSSLNNRASYLRSSDLFENEENSDVIFLVGAAKWRFPGHKSVLSESSPVFAAMLGDRWTLPEIEDGNTIKSCIDIPDVEPKAFENLMRFAYTRDLKLPSVQSAMDALHVADKYLMTDMITICLSFLEVNVDARNVLDILQKILLYTRTKCYQSPPSSPKNMEERENRENALLFAAEDRVVLVDGTVVLMPYVDSPPNVRNPVKMSESELSSPQNRSPSIQSFHCCYPTPHRRDDTLDKRSGCDSTDHSPNRLRPGRLYPAIVTPNSSPARQSPISLENNELSPFIPLVQKCYQTADLHAEQVLRSEEIESIDYDLLLNLITRDSFQPDSEVTIFNAILNWSTQECKRQRKPITMQNRREIAKEALFRVRYFLMTKDEFFSGPARSEILTDEERAWIRAQLCGQSPPECHLHDRKRYMERRRGPCSAFYSPSEIKTRHPMHPSPLHQMQESLSLFTLASLEKDPKKQKCCKLSNAVFNCFVCFAFLFD